MCSNILYSNQEIIKKYILIKLMQKIKSNLGAIQHKFQSLKNTHSQYQEATSIGQVAQVMTYGVVTSLQVQEFLAYVHSDQKIEKEQKINQNWQQLNIKQMILFLDKVIKYRNIPKPNSPQKKSKKQKTNIGIVKLKKTKKKLCQHHKNKYQSQENINLTQQPQSIQISKKKLKKVITVKIDQNGNQYQVEETVQCQREGFQLIQQSQKQNDTNLSDIQEQNEEQSFINDKLQLIQNDSKSKKNKVNENQTVGEILNLGQDFKELSIQQRYQILIEKYQEVKKSLQNKFSKIYKHYRKQMYIPNESFQKNTDLMVDMRIFLKYYRQFEMGKCYGVNIVSNLFKKIAINGLWLDFKKFIEIHYQILQLIQIVKVDQSFQTNKDNLLNDKKYKHQITTSIKNLIKNLIKLKNLASLVSNEKINKIMNKNKMDGGILKKIVEVHTGFTKQDVILKLNQRIIQRQMKKQRLSKNYRSNGVQTQSCSTQKDSPIKRKPGELSFAKSVYTQLQLPKLSTRQLKKSSVYSSLQQLHMHKEREKLKKIINQEEQQKYLDIYFNKQRKGNLKKSNSMIFQVIRNESYKNSSGKIHRIQASLSLPKMKFNI